MSGLKINSGKSGTRNRENVSIRSIAESTRVCVKLKAVTEIIGAVRVIYILSVGLGANGQIETFNSLIFSFVFFCFVYFKDGLHTNCSR